MVALAKMLGLAETVALAKQHCLQKAAICTNNCIWTNTQNLHKQLCLHRFYVFVQTIHNLLLDLHSNSSTVVAINN